MEFQDGQETRMFVDDKLAVASSSTSFPPFASTCLCRICHEEEEESSTNMESPCACSGTLKFAHRECIQRWLDEKRSNVCEICLQVFEPGYTVPERKVLVDVAAVTIRESLEAPRISYDPENPSLISASDDAAGSDYPECSPGSLRCASCCRYVAITFTIILLIRHFITVITAGADHYAIGLLTVFLLRATGILLPFYLVMRLLSAIQQAQRQYRMEQLHRRVNSSIDRMEEEELEHDTIQIRS